MFITPTEETSLLQEFNLLPFKEAHFQRVVCFGEDGSLTNYESDPEAPHLRSPFPEALLPLRDRAVR
jgi:hypothetical protein